MIRTIATLGAAAAITLTAGIAGAQDIGKAVKSRQSTMTLYSFYIGQLGAMAKGQAPYDAAKAQGAADALAALATMDQGAMWPEGSDNESFGDKTNALPVAWTTYPAIEEKSKAMAEAATAMAAAAGTSLEALQGAIGPLGKSCGGCHETYRKPMK